MNEWILLGDTPEEVVKQLNDLEKRYFLVVMNPSLTTAFYPEKHTEMVILVQKVSERIG